MKTQFIRFLTGRLGVAMILIAFLAASAQGRSPEDQFEAFQGQFRENTEVILVCIYKESALPGNRWQREATVVQSLKGQWKVGDKIQFWIQLDPGPMPKLPSEIGRLKYLFVDHFSKEPVLLQTGAAQYYDEQLAALVDKYFRKWAHGFGGCPRATSPPVSNPDHTR